MVVGTDRMMERADRLKKLLLLPIWVDRAVGREANALLTSLLFCSITVIAMLSPWHLADVQ